MPCKCHDPCTTLSPSNYSIVHLSLPLPCFIPKAISIFYQLPALYSPAPPCTHQPCFLLLSHFDPKREKNHIVFYSWRSHLLAFFSRPLPPSSLLTSPFPISLSLSFLSTLPSLPSLVEQRPLTSVYCALPSFLLLHLTSLS